MGSKSAACQQGNPKQSGAAPTAAAIAEVTTADEAAAQMETPAMQAMATQPMRRRWLLLACEVLTMPSIVMRMHMRPRAHVSIPNGLVPAGGGPRLIREILFISLTSIS